MVSGSPSSAAPDLSDTHPVRAPTPWSRDAIMTPSCREWRGPRSERVGLAIHPGPDPPPLGSRVRSAPCPPRRRDRRPHRAPTLPWTATAIPRPRARTSRSAWTTTRTASSTWTPFTCTTGRLATWPGPGRARHGHRRQAAPQGRRHHPHLRPRGRPSLRLVGTTDAASDKFGAATRGALRPARGAAMFREPRPHNSILVAGGRDPPGQSALGAPRRARAYGSRTARSPGPLHPRRPHHVRDISTAGSCWPSGDRRPRRRVHHLQHVVDHRRPAHP